MRHPILFAALAICASSQAQAARTTEFAGPNCSLLEPPADAGEVFSQIGGITTAGRVYPRLSQIPADYTGCQVAWIPINSGPRQRSVVYLQSGRVAASQPPPDVPLCRKGEKSSKTGCTPRREMLQVSFPSGCAARTAANGLPSDCMESFQAEFKLNDLIED